jgi:uncharacterized membrane protein YhaH (DUF805 family)
MQKVRHQFFRFNARTARITFIYVAVIPALMGVLAYKTDVSSDGYILQNTLGRLLMRSLKGLYDLRAKRKGDTVYEK